MRNIILICFLLSIFTTSCNVGGTWKDDNISPTIKKQIHALNAQIIEGFTDDKPDKVLSVCSDKLIEQGKNNLTTLMQKVRKSFSLKDFKILNEFYQKNISTNTSTRVFTGISGDHDYSISFKPLNSEMFVTVGYFDNDLNQTSLNMASNGN